MAGSKRTKGKGGLGRKGSMSGQPTQSGVSRSTVARSGSLSEEEQQKLDSLERDMSDLREGLLLSDVRNSMEEIKTTLALLPAEVEQLRTRGYVFRSFLERKLSVLNEQWTEVHPRASAELERRVRELGREVRQVEVALENAGRRGAAAISTAEREVSGLRQRLDGARQSVRAVYSTLEDNVRQTKAQVDEIAWLLDEIDEASFQLHPLEDPVGAVKAQYMEHEKEGPSGLLYLTDQRVIFEQKEEVATKKVLFIATQKETVQELIFAVPVSQVEEAKASDKGFLGRKQLLELLFAPEADLSGALLRLRGADNEEWAGLIGRVKSGEIANERTQPKDEEVVEQVRNVPTKCPTCGATLSADLARGMHEITCEYCGSVIRI